MVSYSCEDLQLTVIITSHLRDFCTSFQSFAVQTRQEAIYYRNWTCYINCIRTLWRHHPEEKHTQPADLLDIFFYACQSWVHFKGVQHFRRQILSSPQKVRMRQNHSTTNKTLVAKMATFFTVSLNLPTFLKDFSFKMCVLLMNDILLSLMIY